MFLIDGGQRAGRGHDQHFIHGLALGGVRRDGVAVRERAVFGRNHPAIGQQNGIALNGFDLDQFAIDEFLLPVRLQQQLVTGSHFQFPFLAHIKRGDACTQWKNVFGTIRVLNFERVIFHGHHRHRFTFFKTMSSTMKMNRHAGTVLPRIPLLCFRP